MQPVEATAPAVALAGATPPRIYRGARFLDRVSVFVTPGGRALDPRRDLADHSTEFEWGYRGSGPAQLALAILADALGDDARALALHQRFKEAVIAGLPRDAGWRLDIADVRRVVEAIERHLPENARAGGM